jgi:hypothetical protein
VLVLQGDSLTGFQVALEDLVSTGVIGSGSSGVVRKVKHTKTGQLFVLKVGADIQSTCDSCLPQPTPTLGLAQHQVA